MIEFNCPSCSATIKVKEDFAGKSGQCPSCKTRVSVPIAAPPRKLPLPPQLQPAAEIKLEPLPSNNAEAIPMPKVFVESPRQEEPDEEIHAEAGQRMFPAIRSTPRHQSLATPLPPTNSFAITSLVIGVLSIVLCWVPILGTVIALLAIIFAICGNISAISRRSGDGFAFGGASLGIVTLVIQLLMYFASFAVFQGFREASRMQEQFRQAQQRELEQMQEELMRVK